MSANDLDAVYTQKSDVTILRIKRKRDEEAPDVLVIEPPAKKGSRGRKSGLDVFQLAETVDADAWKAVQQDELKNRLQELSRSALESLGNYEYDAMPTTSDMLSRQSSAQSQGRHYRVLTQDTDEIPNPFDSYPTSPPKVLSSKDLVSQSSVKIYDAVLEAPLEEEKMEQDMDKFLELVREYLSVTDNDGAHLESITQPESQEIKSDKVNASTSDDYVYDIFYHRPATISEWTSAANMATVTGLPDYLDFEYEYSSESEFEDEADEDSNAEDYYRNDYPDELSSDGDSGWSYSDEDEEDDYMNDPQYAADNWS